MKENHYDEMPYQRHNSTSHPTTISSCIYQYNSHAKGDSVFAGEATRFVMGFPLPPFQRQRKWNVDQCIKLIDNIWLKNPIGTYMINVSRENGRDEFDGWLLDGQQRMLAIQDFIENKFSVKNAAGKEVFWDEIGIVAKRRFSNTNFGHIEVSISSLDELKSIYNTLNFSGTPHENSEKA